MALYHFSEDPDIGVFVPRTLPRDPWRTVDEPLVWAIDDEHAPLFFFPRDCPRICWWPLPQSTADDLDRWWGDRNARMVACTEWAWLEPMRSTRIYRYTMPEETFEPLDEPTGPGTRVSRAAVEPLAVEAVGGLFAALRDANVELRLMHRLTPLRGVWDTSLHASGIRLRNAQDWGPAN